MFIYIHILSNYKLFLYFNLCLSVILEILSCSYTFISFLTIGNVILMSLHNYRAFIVWYFLKSNFISLLKDNIFTIVYKFMFNML
jgi:hypothetical protein